MNATDRITEARERLNASLEVLSNSVHAEEAWRALAKPISDYTAEVIAAIKSDSERSDREKEAYDDAVKLTTAQLTAKFQGESEAHARRAVERAIRVASNLADTMVSEEWSLLDILGPTDAARIVTETK